MIAACIALALAWMPPQGPSDLLRVERVDGAVRVSANRAGVTSDAALRELADRMGWQLRFHPASLAERLREQIVDLAFRDEDPRTVARLLAVAGGADAVFFATNEDGVERIDLTVVPSPDARTEANRARLREQALDWYRLWLDRRIERGLTDDAESVRVRWHVAELLREQGDADEAARLYATLCAEDGHELVPAARLRLAEVLFELGPERWVEAERQVRELVRLHPSRPESAEGVLLLGRLLLARGRARECAATLESAYLQLTGMPEILEAHLLVARARLELGEAEAARAALRQLAGVRAPSSLPGPLRREELLLRGSSEVALGAAHAAIDAFRTLLADEEVDDGLRARALVGLGEACLLGGRAVHAAAAIATVEPLRESLDATWQARLVAVIARTAFVFGEDERGFIVLEDAIRAGEAVELRLLLARELLARGRVRRARDVATPLTARDDQVGDAARVLVVEAALARAREPGEGREWLESAVACAKEIRDSGLRSRTERRIAEAGLEAGAFLAVADLDPRATVRAGIAALRDADRLMGAGDPAFASTRRAEAQRLLERARSALAGIRSEPEPSLDGLFLLARCEEALGRSDAARALWREIVARDASDGGRADDERRGPWGRSAAIALAVTRWLEETGGWNPRVDVDTIHWQQR